MTRLLKGFAPAIALLCLISACAGEPGRAAAGRASGGTNGHAYEAVGVASWYGVKFQGGPPPAASPTT